MAGRRKQSHIRDYELARPKYVLFANNLKTLLESLLKETGIKFHVVEARAKTVESFAEKISRPGKRYKNPAAEIEDFCGCRIICYFQDDIELVISLIRSEFEIIEEEFTHIKERLESNRFGYLSHHLIANLGKNRKSLPEWRAFSDLSVEIQIRTLVQHAWSAVSHTVQYKQDSDVPSALQRRLNRLAGIFELADEEFVAIRQDRKQLKIEARDSIASGNTNIAINADSIDQFLATWSGAAKLLSDAESAGFNTFSDYDPVDDDGEEIDEMANLSTLAQRAGLKTISDLSRVVDESNNAILRVLLKRDEDWTVSLGFLATIILVQEYRKILSREDLISNGFHYTIADRVLAAAAKVENA